MILPLSLQGMAAGAIFVFIFSWNEFLFALIFTTQHAKTAPLLISEMMGAIDGAEWGVLFAGVTAAAAAGAGAGGACRRSTSSPA